MIRLTSQLPSFLAFYCSHGTTGTCGAATYCTSACNLYSCGYSFDSHAWLAVVVYELVMHSIQYCLQTWTCNTCAKARVTSYKFIVLHDVHYLQHTAIVPRVLHPSASFVWWPHCCQTKNVTLPGEQHVNVIQNIPHYANILRFFVYQVSKLCK